jgi:hypothetical protein
MEQILAGETIMKHLSEQLAELSRRARNVEDAFTQAEKEARDKIDARRAQAIVAAQSAVEKINRQVKTVADSASRDWAQLQAKITSDMSDLAKFVAQAKHKMDIQRAEDRAQFLEVDATFAIDYAVAAVEQAQLAVLDAVEARRIAEEAKRS